MRKWVTVVGSPVLYSLPSLSPTEPDQPPGNVRIEPVDFQQVRISWEPPEEESWKCDQVELALHYSNGTGAPKTQIFPVDGPREVSEMNSVVVDQSSR